MVDPFPAFRVPGYRWLLLNWVFLAATFAVEELAQGWLILRLTGSPFWLGAAAGVGGLSQFLASVPGGALADRLDRRALALGAQALAALGAAALGVLVLTDAVRLWHLLALLCLGNVTGAVAGAARMALAADVIGPERLLNANAFGFVAWSLAAMGAAFAGGLLIQGLGIAPAYLLVAAAYLLSSGVLLPLRASRVGGPSGPSAASALREGLRYSLRARQVRRLLLLSIVTEGFATPFVWFMPAMARDVLRVGARGLGSLAALANLGGLAAGLYLAASRRPLHPGRLLLGGAFGFGLGVALFGLSPWFPLSLALAALIGFAGSIYDATVLTALQTSVPAEMRGRVLGLLGATWSASRLGGFGTGALAGRVGVPLTLAIGGAVAAANALRLAPMAGALTVAGPPGEVPGSGPS